MLNTVTSLLLYHIATSYDLKIKNVTKNVWKQNIEHLCIVIWQHFLKNSTARKFNEEIRIYLFNHNIICFNTVKLCIFPVRKNKCKLESLRMLNKIEHFHSYLMGKILILFNTQLIAVTFPKVGTTLWKQYFCWRQGLWPILLSLFLSGRDSHSSWATHYEVQACMNGA